MPVFLQKVRIAALSNSTIACLAHYLGEAAVTVGTQALATQRRVMRQREAMSRRRSPRQSARGPVHRKHSHMSRPNHTAS
jgi:hypothetical protein